MNESQFSSYIGSALKTAGAKVLKLHGHAMQAAGWPDTYVSHWNWRGWVEFKVGSRKLTPLQLKFIGDLNIRGDNAIVMRLDSARHVIEVSYVDKRYEIVGLGKLTLESFDMDIQTRASLWAIHKWTNIDGDPRRTRRPEDGTAEKR
jgi:hypothetical protein